jgi:hypothetical protein
MRLSPRCSQIASGGTDLLRAQQAKTDSPAPPSLKPPVPSPVAAVKPRSPFLLLDQLSPPGWLSKPALINHYQPKSAPPSPAASNSNPYSREDLLGEFGLVNYGQKVFYRGQRQIVVDVYDFASSDGAYGAYLCLHQGASNLIAHGDASSEAEQNISLWKERYFFNLSAATAGDDESKELITKLATELAQAIPASSPKPVLLSSLPSLDKVRGSEKLVMGPLALKKHFPAPYISIFSCPGSVFQGAIADYQTQEPYRERMRLLLIRIPGPRSYASELFSQFLGQLEEQHDPLTIPGSQYQTSVFKLDRFYILCQLRNQAIVIITGARKKQSLTALCDEITSPY